MGDGAIDLSSPKTNELYGPPPPPPPVSDKDKTEDKKEAAPPPPPPSPQELQKITAEVKKLKSLKLPEDMFDSEGNLKPDRLKDAKDLLAEKARDLKKTDLGASARMMQQAVSLYPSDTNLRLEAAQYWVEWADKTKDKNVRMAQLERAFQILKDVDVDPAVDPVVAGEKFRIAKRLCAGHIGSKDFEKATYYLDQAVRNGQPHELIEILNGFKEHPHPEVYGKYNNPYDFFADSLVDAVRFEDAKGVYDMAARDTETSDPTASKFFKEKSQIVAQHLDPKPDYDKFSAWQESYQGMMDSMLEANGRYKSAFAGDAKARVQKQAQAFVETPDMQKLRPGSEEFNRRLTHFLSQETEYHLLPTKEQADVLKEGFSVNYDGKKFTYDLVEVYKDKWYPYRTDFFSTDAGRKGLWLKREGDRLMAQGGGGPIAAVAHYQKSVDLNPDDTMARVGLARAQTAMGKMAGNKRLQKYCFDLAAKNLGYSAEGDPNKWQVLHATGDLLLASGHPKQALSFLQEALRLAQQTGAPEYSLNDKIAMSGPGGAEVKLNDTPLGQSIQKAIAGSAEAMGKELYSEDVKPRDRLVEAMMRKGVTASQVTDWWNKTFTVLKTTEDKVGGDQFLEYALKHLDQFRGELEQVYGKLPYDKEGKLNPNLQQAAQTYLDGRKKRAEDAAEKQGLKPDTPEFKEAVEASLKQKDDLAEAYTTLLAPDDPSNPGRSYIDKAGAYNVVQGVMLEAAAEEAKAQGPGGVQKAFQYYQQAGEAFKRSYDLTGDRRFMRTSAKSFYQAAYIARQGGDEQAARDLFLKGATVLQFGGEATLRDPQALKLMGDGLMEVGRYKEAKAIYDSAQEPLIQYFGSHDDAPEGLLDRLKLSSIYCHKMSEVEEKLGQDFMDAKAALTEKRNAGKLTPAEKADLERMERGYDTLKRLCGLQFPPVIDANEMPGIRNLREDIISAIHAGDVKRFDELMTTAQRQIQNAETLQMADSLRKKTLLPQLPPQVQEYIKRTNDWSILRASYQEGDRLPEDWNPAQLNDMPVLKALREWDEKNPEQAKQIRASLEAFGRPRIVPGGEAATDLEKFNAEVDAVAKTLFKTDAEGKLPVDPKTGARIFEPTEAFGAWFQDATELDLRDKPEAWMQSNLTEYRQNLGAIGRTLASFETVRKDYKETQQKLAAAEKAGNAGQAAIHKKHLEDLRGQIAELRANYTQVFQAQVGEFNADLTQFEAHSKKLGKVGEGGKYAYQDALLAAQGKLKTTGDGLSGLAADADPEQVLDAMIGSAQELARAESTLLKGVTLVHTSNLQGFKPGEKRTEVEDFAGEDMKYHGSSKPATVKTWWENDPKWTAAMEKLDKQFEEGGSFDAAGIDKLLTANLAYLKETDQQMFKDLPTTVREGISMQLSQLHTMRKQKLDAGEEVREYDTLIEKYQDAEKALKAGNVERALALFRVATESKRQSRVHKDFENFQSDQKWKMIALEVAIITVAAAATAVTMGALAPVAGAAAAAGTAAVATEVGLILLEGAVFVGYEMLMRSALYAAKEEFQLKGFGMSTIEDPWRDIHGVGDLGWKVVTNAAMLKALKVVGEGYQVLTLSERALARAGATALLEDATAVGMRRAMMRELLQKEMAELSMGGKALYNVGAFTAEAAGMQAWSSAQIGLDMLYQRVAHGKKLEWKQYTAALEQANSAEQIEHGIATLVGLKLGGLTTHPIIARYQSSTQVAASQKIKLDLFLKTKGQFETRLQTEMEKAALAGKPFEMSPELRGEARKLMEIGHEAMDVAGQLEKGKGLKVFTEQEKATWRESHDWLGKWVEYSGKEAKLKGGPGAAPADDKKGAAPAKGGTEGKGQGEPVQGKVEPDAGERAKQQREKARVAEFEKGLGFRERKAEDGTGIEKFDVKTGQAVDKKDYTVEDLNSYKAYEQQQTAKKELRAKFEEGQRVLPVAKEKGKYELVDAKGERVREATREELGQYLQFKKDGVAFAKAETLRKEAVEKARQEQLAQWTEAFGKGVSIEEVRRGDGVLLGYRVKGAEGEAAKLFLKDKGELWATPAQFKAFKTFTNEAKLKAEQARNQAATEAKLQEGFAEGQQIILNADTGKYELQDAKGKTLRVATDAEQKLFTDFQTKKQEHEVAVGKRAEALAPEFEAGVQIREKVDKYEVTTLERDPNASPVEGAGKKVTYYVKVKPDGTRESLNQKDIGDIKAGRSPEVLGFEKVDKEGKVIDGPPVSKDDHEAYQHWYGQKKEAAKVVVLKAVEPPADSGQPGAPAPKKKAADADPAMTRAADAGRAFDLSFDHAMRSGKPPTTEELTQVVQRNMESLEALQPALDGLPKAKRQAVKEGILQQLADGKLSKEQAVELAAKVAKGEAEIVPNAKAEYGYEVKVKEAPKPKADDVTKTDPAAKKRVQDADDAGPPTQRDGAKGKKQEPAPEDPVLGEGVRRVLELQSGRAEWQRSLRQAEDFGTPKDKAAAKEVRTAADNVKSLSTEYLKAKAELKKHAEGSPERLAAQKRVDELQGELRKNLDVIQKWEDYPKERTKVAGHLRDAAFPFLERAIQGQGHDKGLGEAPEGARILDVSFRQPGYGDDFQAGPGKTTGEYEVLIHVRTEADAQAVLKEARLNHGENKAQFVKDADGKVRSVEMTTPDGRVFSVRVELATTENRAEVTDRGGIAGASHEGVGYKEYNEDRQVVVTFENGRTVTLVIDGMGGTQGGEMAAKLAKTAFEKAVKEGKSVETGIELANEAVAAYGKELLPALTERLMKEQNLDRATAEHYAKYMLPGAVAMGTEISRNANGTYNARFRSVGDCEAAVIRFKPNGEVEILDAYGRSEADILKSRSDPNANIVDQSLGGHSGPLKIRTKDVTVEKGDIVLNGSDGFFENFGSHAEIAFLIRESGAKTPAEVRDVLMREALIRQQLADTLQKSGQENMTLTPEAYAKAYQAVTGQEPPAGWKGMWEGKVLDMMGNVGEAKDLGRVQVTYADGQSFEFRGVPRDKTQSHFKKDNTTLVVQGVGEAVRPDTVTPSRAELAKEQMGLALELARSFGLEKNADFMKDLNALVLRDVASGGRAPDAAGREALLRQRTKEAKALAERYGMDKNPAFMKLLGRLVVDNLRETEVRFGEAPKQGAPADPKLTGFMERQRGYGLKLAKGFEAKVDPAKREKFKMDLGKILSQDAAGLPSGGDPAVEAKFKTNREAVVEAFAKEYGLDGDANFMKAAKMLLVDRVLKECPRVEPRGPKVDPIVRQTGQRLESEIYDRALRAGRNKEEAAQLAEQARGHFEAALKEGKKPEEAFTAASDKMSAEFKETVRPGAAAPKEPTPAEKETVRPGKAQGGDKQALTPSGVRPQGSKPEETTGELKTEVDHLAAGDTPFAEAARDLQAGKITLTEYRARQKQVAEKMVEEHKAAYEDVMGFLTEIGKDPALGVSQEFPPKGRMKAADDIAPKLVRRGWQDMAPLTDVAGTRIVVRSNADAEAVIARIQEKYKIREAYMKDGSIEADLMTPSEMKSKGIKEEDGVVWIDAKLDQDGIHRLVDGHPASGYRALHIVVEVDGKPVEIQIKTEAMHEWGEIEHKLVYKNKDLPAEVLDPIKKFRQEASDYLAKVTHREPGEKLPEMPKPPELPADVPNRGEIQKGLDDMVSLMKKYSEGEPGGGQVLQIPKAPKAPDVEGINRKAAYLTGLYERIFPEPVGRPGLKNMDLDGEINMIRERLVEGGHQALLEKFDADYKTLMTEPMDSPQFKAAVERLGDVLALNHGDPRFRQPVVFMSEAGFAEFAKASQEVYDKSAGPAPGAKEGKGADVIPFRPKAKSDTGTEVRKAADSSDPESLSARLGAKDADPNKALEPLAGIEKRLEATEPELAAGIKADRETILKGDKDSPAYQEAMQRLGLLDTALRGPLEYGKNLSDKDVAGFVRPLYAEKGPDSQGPKGSGRDSNTGTLATGTGLLMGLLALVAPETARAADGVMRGGPNIGPVEIAMIVGIGTLLAIPVVRRFLSSPKPSADLSPATRDNPVRLEHNGVVTAIRPLETRDYQGGRVVDGFVGTFSKEGSKVHGDGVELAYRVTDPSSGAVTANTKVYLSKAEAQRLGVKFDAKGTQVVEVPNHGIVVKQYAVGTPANVGVAADAGSRGGPAVANHPPLEVSVGTTYFQVMADAQGRPVVDQYMGQVSPPLLTFQRGPKGQWYVFEGKPSMDFYAAQADPVARRYWKPVKDGDLFQVGDSVVPFKAPADDWIQYQMPDGSVQRCAPPAVGPGAPPPIAFSGKLPVGEARTVVPKSDGSPFVIGRGQGDLQFTDSNVSGVHATIVRNQADGKWYLVDGPMGDASKVSRNGVYVIGGRMPKYYPIKDGEYFVINGATFQFREPAQAAPQAPPVPPPPPAAPSNAAVLQAGPHGGPVIDLGGRSFTVSPWQQGWTEMGTQYLGRITSASRVPNDPQGKIRLDVRTRRGMGAEEGRITLEMTPAEAAALNIKLRPDGSLQPGPKEPYLSFGEILPQPVALAADAGPNPAVQTRARPQPPPLPARRGPVDLKDGAGQAYQLEAAPVTEGLVPGKLIGSVTRLEPLPGNSGGKLFMVVEIRPDLRPDSPIKTVSFSVTPQEAARLGLKLDAQGRLVEGSPRGLKIAMPGAEIAVPKPKPGAPGEVQGVWADNAPGAPRRGEVGKKEATEVYGTSAGKTHEGIGYKEKNEDAVVQGDNFAVVLDGMGGHKGGDAASRISGEAIAKYISENQGKMPPEELLTKALLEGDRAVKASDVYRQAPKDEKPGAVGVVHLVVKNADGSHDVYLAHVGDAGAIVVGKDGKVKHRSVDQSLLQDFYQRAMRGDSLEKIFSDYTEIYGKNLKLEPFRPFYEKIQDHGKNTEQIELDIRAHPYANIVSGGLGTSGDPKPIVQKFRLESGDKIVMFSDGVGDANATADLAKVAHESKSAKEASERIMDGTLERMADLEDAMAELPPGKRLPIVRSDGEIAYVDNKGNIYKSLKPEPGEKVVDHYKADNATVHVYFHDPKAGGSDPVKPGPDRGVKESGVRLKPPPVPPGAKQAPKVEAVKPENDIDFKSLPPENLLTQDELAGLDRLNKRPHVKEILHDPTLRPVTKVTVGDQTFYLSRVIETVDERGEVRPHVLALVPVKENGQTVLKRRFFYKSNSDGGWRASPYILGGRYAKGVGVHYTQETQPIPELAAHFQKLEEAAGGVTKVRMTDAEFDKYIDVGSPLLNQDAQGTMLAGFGKEVMFPSNVGMTNIGALQPGAAFKAGAYSGASDPAIVPKLAHLTYPDGFIPDFAQGPAKTYTETHTLLGKITCREFQGGYLVEKGSGRKRPVIWTMAEDANGRTWVKSIRYTDSKVNSYGVYDEVIDSGIITSKPLEYAEQSYKLPAEYRPDFNGQYVDITPALNMLKPIRDYRASRGLPNPELPKGPPPSMDAPSPKIPPSPKVPPPVPKVPPPPPQTPKAVQSQVQGLSGTEGRWVYRMDPGLAQVFLGREAFMGESGTEGVSGKHVRIFRADGTTFIEDSVSSNGTQVWRDGKMVWSSRGKADAMKSIFPIRPGDKIFMGGVEVTFNPA